MDKIKCPKCQHEININISQAVDEHAEVFKCPNCKYLFRYVNK